MKLICLTTTSTSLLNTDWSNYFELKILNFKLIENNTWFLIMKEKTNLETYAKKIKNFEKAIRKELIKLDGFQANHMSNNFLKTKLVIEAFEDAFGSEAKEFYYLQKATDDDVIATK